MRTIAKLIFALSLSILTAVASHSGAHAQSQAHPDYCRHTAPRSTFIFIDITTSGVQNGQWLPPIVHGVRFLPNEPVYVIWFNPANGEGKQLFFDCFPGLTPEEQQAQANDPGTQFTALFVGPASQAWIRDQRRFIADLGQAADVLSRAAGGRTPTIANKAIAEFLARERHRFNESAGVPRLLIFSDMAQNSSFTAPLSNRNPEEEANQAIRRIPNNFGFAEVYAYGVDPSLGGSVKPNSQESALAAFWRTYFQKSNAQLKSFDRTLPQRRAEGEPIQEAGGLISWEGGIAHLSGGDQNHYAPAGMQMLITSKLKVENAWLNLPGVGAVPFTGTLRCSNAVECNFVGQLDGDLAGALVKGDGLEFSTFGERVQGEIRLVGVDLLKVSDRLGLAPPSYDIAFVRSMERLR